MSHRLLSPLRRSVITRVGMALSLVLVLGGCAQKVTETFGGGACTSDGDCGDDFVCRNRICTPTSAVCSPGRRTCDGSTVIRCAPDGLGYTQETACEVGCANGQCIVPVCTAGEPRCAGNVLQKCSADQTYFESVQVCARGCDTGTSACIANQCPAGARQCEDGVTLKTCNPSGTAWQSTSCTSTANPGHCVTAGALDDNLGSYCERYSCRPNTVRCDGLEVVTCKADGAGETPVALCEHGCSEGKCSAAVCEPTAERCSSDGLARERCNLAGTAWIRQDCDEHGPGSCAATHLSDGTVQTRCVQPICTPGAKVCSGAQWLECAQDGLSQTVLETCEFECAPATGCFTITCTPELQSCTCAAGAERCSGNFRQTCAPDRNGYQTNEYCLAGCVNANGTTSCNPVVCPPYTLRCGANGTSIESCKSDGSAWVTRPDLDCLPGDVCSAAICVHPTPGCVEGVRRCLATGVQVCSAGAGADGYATLGECLGTCTESDCDSLTGVCNQAECDSAGGCTPFLLALAPHQGALAADGNSTYLVKGEGLKGPDGQAVPNGTLVNVWVDGTSILSTDGSVLPGQQVSVQSGSIQFVIRAPARPGEATIGARVGTRSTCSATLVLSFGATSP